MQQKTDRAADRAEYIENQIADAKAKRRQLIADAPQGATPRDLALAHLGEGGSATKVKTADLAAHQDEVARLDETIRGLIEMRVEVEEDVLTERQRDADAAAAANGTRLGELEAEMRAARQKAIDLEREYQTLVNTNAQLLRRREDARVQLLDGKRGLNTHFDDLRRRLHSDAFDAAAA